MPLSEDDLKLPAPRTMPFLNPPSLTLDRSAFQTAVDLAVSQAFQVGLARGLHPAERLHYLLTKARGGLGPRDVERIRNLLRSMIYEEQQIPPPKIRIV